MTTADKRHPAFTDTDPMPFGKHKGEPLQDVPASYLAWLWRDGIHEFSGNGDFPAWLADKRKLANYIHNSRDAIASEIGETL